MSTLGQHTARGVVWTFGATLVNRLAWLAGLAVLTRILAPEQFGIFAFALAFIAYVETISDLGTRAALIYWPVRTKDVAAITFIANILMGLFWFGVAQLVAPMVAAFFHQPAAETVLRVLAVSFVIKALGNTHDALCQKQLRFKARLVPELALALGKTLPAVGLAVAGFGIWSLVFAQLIGTLLWAAALWIIVPWRPGLHVAIELLAPILRYGRAIVAVNLLGAVLHHIDLVIVGRMFGAEILGFYHVAAKVPQASIAVVIWISGTVLFPAFARVLADGRNLKQPYLTALRYTSVLTLPTAAGLLLIAEPLTVTIFGEAWRPVAPLLQALAIYLGLRSLGAQAGDVLKATGRAGLLARLGVIKAAILIPSLLLAAHYSPQAVAWTLAGVTVATVALNVAVVSRMLEIRLHELTAAVTTSAVATTTMILTLIAMAALLPALPPFLDVIGCVVVGAGVYALTIHRLDPSIFRTACALAGKGAGAREPDPVFEP